METITVETQKGTRDSCWWNMADPDIQHNLLVPCTTAGRFWASAGQRSLWGRFETYRIKDLEALIITAY